MWNFSGDSGYQRNPLPRMTGNTSSRSSSTSPLVSNACTRVRLPMTSIGPPSPAFSARTPATTPPSTATAFQVRSPGVDVTTSLRIAFIVSANAPSPADQPSRRLS